MGWKGLCESVGLPGVGVIVTWRDVVWPDEVVWSVLRPGDVRAMWEFVRFAEGRGRGFEDLEGAISFFQEVFYDAADEDC